MDDFAGDVAVVTGGTRGIGREISAALVDAGATVVAFYRSDDAAADEVADALADADGDFHARAVDVREFDAVADAVDAVADAHGPVTRLVNNAGVMENGLLARMDEDAWDAVLDTNLKGAFNCLRAVTPGMLVGDGGAVVNVASVAALRGWPGQANYAASKSGLLGLTRSAARELGGRGVRVNAVAPGYVRTDLLDSLDDAAVRETRARVPLDRLADPEEVAAAVTFLLGDDASYVNGSVLRVDGGLLG